MAASRYPAIVAMPLNMRRVNSSSVVSIQGMITRSVMQTQKQLRDERHRLLLHRRHGLEDRDENPDDHADRERGGREQERDVDGLAREVDDGGFGHM